MIFFYKASYFHLCMIIFFHPNIGGLFTETFYGLKRFPDPRSLDVSKQKVVVWVFLSVVGPYLQSHLKILYENLREKHRDNTLQYNVSYSNTITIFYNTVVNIYYCCIIEHLCEIYRNKMFTNIYTFM